jgi:menaquinone-dependent protoporphyrinogen oxidase
MVPAAVRGRWGPAVDGLGKHTKGGGAAVQVLIGHASAHGSTEEIALRMAGVLEHEGLSVDVLPISRLGGLDGHDAVVLGSAIHQQAWLPEAMAFVQRHTNELVARPVWLFSVGMSASLPRAVRTSASKAQDRRLAGALRDLVRPRGHRLFSGVAREEDFPRWTTVLFRMLGARFGDFRDWDQIEDWAREIAHDLRSARLRTAGET